MDAILSFKSGFLSRTVRGIGMTILCAFLLLFWPRSGRAAITLVQHNFTGGTTTALTSQTATFTSNPAQNDLLVAGGGNYSAGPVSSCSDTLANTWTVIETAANGVNTNTGICWAIQTHTPGADTVTMNDASGKQFSLFIAEYSGTATSSPFDVGSTGTGTATAVTTGSFTTTAVDVIFAVVVNGTAQTTTAGSGYTLLDNQTAFKGVDEDELNPAAGTYQGTFTNSVVDGGWSVSAAAFKPSGGGLPPCANFIALMGAGCK